MDIQFDTANTIRILASDNAELMRAIRTAQRNDEKCDVIPMSNGLHALDSLTCSPFDLAIVDLSMHRFDGLRLIALIRATPRLRKMPILAISPTHKPASTLESLLAGADDYLPRPIEWPLLAMRIRQLTKPANYLACA